MKKLKIVHVVVIVCLAALGTFTYAQYGMSSVELSESPELSTNAYDEEQGFKGEWIESLDNALVVSSANDQASRPTNFPYFYLSRNWERCVEFTAEAPQGKPCSGAFKTALKQAEAFLLKE